MFALKNSKKVDNILGTWEDKDYFSLTSMSEVDGRKGVAEEELLEMTIMALQDMEPEGPSFRRHKKEYYQRLIR